VREILPDDVDLGNAAATSRVVRACVYCPYQTRLTRRTVSSVPLLRPPLDGTDAHVEDPTAAFRNLPKAREPCPNPRGPGGRPCGNEEAWFRQVQLRSADEPATLFYVCCRCQHQWREG